MRGIKKTIDDMDKVLLIISIILCIFGLFNIVTASSREAVNNLDQSIYYYFYRQLAVLIIGFIGFIIVIGIPTNKYYKFLPLLYIIILGLNAILIFKGAATRGANNWISLGFFNLQPSELAKPILIVTLALLMETMSKKLRNPRINHWNYIGVICAIGLVIPLLVILQKDLGTALILLAIFGIVYLLSPILPKEKFKLVFFLLIFGVILLMIIYSIQGSILTPAQKSRFNFIDPCDSKNYIGDGYQICNAFISINLGGLTGVGIGKSTQKYSYIPEPHTDMVFAIIAEEYGYLFCMGILILYGVILWRILNLSSKANTIRGKFICLGVATYIFAHIYINLGGLFGLIPLTGVPLPFLSYGGSFTISLLVAIALVERIHIETKRHKIKF